MESSFSILPSWLWWVKCDSAGCTNSAAVRRAASPTLGGWITLDAITGKVHDIVTKHESTKESIDELLGVRMDDQAKMDRVAVEDCVPASLSEDREVTTIQEFSDELSVCD